MSSVLWSSRAAAPSRAAWGAIPPRFGQVVLLAPDGQSATLVLAGDSTHAPAAGGWQATPRSRQKPAVWYSGPDEPGDLQIACAIDTRLQVSTSLAEHLGYLQALAAPASGQDAPPVLKVACTALPLASRSRWVIADISYGAVIETQTGGVVRQEVTLALTEHQDLDTLQAQSPRVTRTSKAKRRTRVIQSRPGDTMRAIAVRQLGSAGDWKQIRGWNKTLAKTNPDLTLRTGTRVVLR